MSSDLQFGVVKLALKGKIATVVDVFVRDWAEQNFVLAKNERIVTGRAVNGALNYVLRGNEQKERYVVIGDTISTTILDLPQFKFAVLKNGDEMIQKVTASKAVDEENRNNAKVVSTMAKVLKANGINF